MSRNSVKRVLIILGVVTAASIAFIWGVKSWNKKQEIQDVATARDWAGLAPFPHSAHNLQVFRNDTLTWTAYCVKFSAAPQEINAFLARSPGLKAKPGEVFSPKHQYTDAHFSDRDIFKRSAPWFNRTITLHGRRYTTEWQGNYGDIVINDITNTVYIYVYNS